MKTANLGHLPASVRFVSCISLLGGAYFPSLKWHTDKYASGTSDRSGSEH